MTKVVESDSDYVASSEPSTGSFRTRFYDYSSTFPSMVTTLARKSSVHSSDCTSVSDTNCAKTTMTYNSSGNVTQVQHTGLGSGCSRKRPVP